MPSLPLDTTVEDYTFQNHVCLLKLNNNLLNKFPKAEFTSKGFSEIVQQQTTTTQQVLPRSLHSSDLLVTDYRFLKQN